MTNKYELVFVLSMELGDDGIEAYQQRVEDLINEHGEVADVDVWGQRRLAYEIEDQREGHYILIHFNSVPEFPEELDRVLKLNDQVLRHMIVRAED